MARLPAKAGIVTATGVGSIALLGFILFGFYKAIPLIIIALMITIGASVCFGGLVFLTLNEIEDRRNTPAFQRR